MLTFGWESCRAVFAAPNIGDLLRAHWEELAIDKEHLPLDPDYALYTAMNEADLYRLWVAREKPAGRASRPGTLAGYIGWFIHPHIHYKTTLLAIDDLYLLMAQHRQGANGWRMFNSSIAALREIGVKRVVVHEKVHFQAERGGLGALFRRLGLTHTDNVWTMML